MTLAQQLVLHIRTTCRELQPVTVTATQLATANTDIDHLVHALGGVYTVTMPTFGAYLIHKGCLHAEVEETYVRLTPTRYKVDAYCTQCGEHVLNITRFGGESSAYKIIRRPDWVKVEPVTDSTDGGGGKPEDGDEPADGDGDSSEGESGSSSDGGSADGGAGEDEGEGEGGEGEGEEGAPEGSGDEGEGEEGSGEGEGSDDDPDAGEGSSGEDEGEEGGAGEGEGGEDGEGEGENESLPAGESATGEPGEQDESESGDQPPPQGNGGSDGDESEGDSEDGEDGEGAPPDPIKVWLRIWEKTASAEQKAAAYQRATFLREK